MESKQDQGVEGLLRQIIGQLNGAKGCEQLAAAYVQAWAEVDNVVKNANNPHFGSDYADLNAVIETIKPVFSRFDLAILGPVPGAITNGNQSFTTLLMHKSGQHLAFNGEIPLGAKLTAQAAGSSTTYFRRYTWTAIGGIAQKDDDGESASSAAPEPKRRTVTAAKPEAEKGPTYADGVEALVTEINEFAGTYEELEKQIRPRVEEIADQALNDVYTAKRRTLKKGKK